MVKKPIITILIIIAIIAVIVFAVVDFISNVQTHDLATANSNLDFSAAANAKSVYLEISDSLTTLASVAVALEDYEDYTSNEALAMLSKVAKYVGFERISVDTVNGISYFADGTVLNVTSLNVTDIITSGKFYVSDVMDSLIDRQPIVNMSVPIKNSQGVPVAQLRGAFRTKGLSEKLNISLYSNKTMFYVIDSNGRYVAASTELDDILKSGNFYEDMRNVEFNAQKDYNYEQMIADMEVRKSFHMEYTDHDEEILAHIAPIEIRDWNFVMLEPMSVVDSVSSVNIRFAMRMALYITLVFAVIVFYVIYLQIKARKADRRTQLMFNSSPFMCMYWSKDFDIIDCNETTITTFKTKDKQEFFEKFLELSPKLQPNGKNSVLMVKELVQNAFSKGIQKFEFMHQTADGEPLPMEIMLIRVELDKQTAVIAHCRDLREHKKMLSKIDEMVTTATLDERCFRVLASHCNMAVAEWNYSITKVKEIKNYEELIALDVNQKKDYNDLLSLSMIYPDDLDAHIKLFQDLKNGKAIRSSMRMRLLTERGSYIWVQFSSVTIMDDAKKPYKTIGFYEDIDSKVKEEESLNARVQSDVLTRLLNKGAVEILVEEILCDSKEGETHALICLDIDDFKYINDNFGHLFGDKVLIETAAIIKHIFRSSDVLGRFGGDEFVLLIKNIEPNEFAKEKVEVLRKALNKTYTVDGVSHTSSASIGVAFFPKDAQNYKELYKKADKACYHAKHLGKNRYVFYDEYSLSDKPYESDESN